MWSCRTCFVTGVKLITLGESQERDFLENSLNSYGASEGLDKSFSVCYECKSFLNKCCNFIKKALRARQAFLMYQDQIMVDTDTLTKIRNEWALNSTLGYYTVPINFYLKHEEFEKDKEKALNDAFSNVCILNVKSEMNSSNINDNASDIESNKPCNQENKILISLLNKSHVNINTLKYPKEINKNAQPRRKPHEVYIIHNSSSQNEPQANLSLINEENILSNKRKRVMQKFLESESDTEIPRRKISKQKIKENAEFTLDNMSTESESDSSDEELYDDNGKRLKRPPREYPRQCDHCEQTIMAGKYHYKHYLANHSHELYPYRRISNYSYVCQHCGKCYPSEYKLAKHESTHGEKTVACPLCNKKFYHKVHLERHHRVVHDEMKCFCDYCNKGFPTKSDLKRHIRIHTGDKPYKCHLCPAAFAHLGNRNLHLKSHIRLPTDSESESDCALSRYVRKRKTVKRGKLQRKVCKKITKKVEGNSEEVYEGKENNEEQSDEKKAMNSKKRRKAMKNRLKTEKSKPSQENTEKPSKGKENNEELSGEIEKNEEESKEIDCNEELSKEIENNEEQSKEKKAKRGRPKKVKQ